MRPSTQEFDGAEFFTVGLDLGDSVAASFHCRMTGVCGIASLEASNDDSDWVPLGISAESFEGESLMLNSPNAGFRYLRLDWMPTCGSGRVTVISIIKDVG